MRAYILPSAEGALGLAFAFGAGTFLAVGAVGAAPAFGVSARTIVPCSLPLGPAAGLAGGSRLGKIAHCFSKILGQRHDLAPHARCPLDLL